jgi:hypothetical protein
MADTFIVITAVSTFVLFSTQMFTSCFGNKKVPIEKFNLFIDVTQKKLNMAVFKTPDKLKTLSIPTKNNLTDIAIEYIDCFLKVHRVNKEDIANIYLTSGPGSFTGVRVGCLLVKA